MKRFLRFLSVCLAFATVAILQAADDPANVPQPTASFQTEGAQVSGTITVPPGQCVYGGFRSDMWQGYMHGFSFAPDAAVPLDAVTFKVQASIIRRTDKILAVAGGWQLATPERDPAKKFRLTGDLRQWGRVGTEVPEKPRSITLDIVYDPAKAAGQAVPVATWTIAYPGTRKADVITLDLWTATNRDELAAKIRTRNRSKLLFAEVRSHRFD